MRLHSVVVLTGLRIVLVYLYRGSEQGRIRIALVGFRAAASLFCGCGCGDAAGRISLRERSLIRTIGNTHQRGGILGFCLCFGDHDPNRLTAKIDSCILQHLELIARDRLHGRLLLEGLVSKVWCVLVRQDQYTPLARSTAAVSIATIWLAGMVDSMIAAYASPTGWNSARVRGAASHLRWPLERLWGKPIVVLMPNLPSLPDTTCDDALDERHLVRIVPCVNAPCAARAPACRQSSRVKPFSDQRLFDLRQTPRLGGHAPDRYTYFANTPRGIEL